MPSYTTYRLLFRGPVHLGRLGLEQAGVSESCPSDTLFSALLDTAADSGGPAQAEALLEPFLAGDPPWCISSAFPFAGEVAFYPRPLLALVSSEGDLHLRKWLKRLRYLSQGALALALQGKGLDAALSEPSCRLPSGGLVLPEEARSLKALPDSGAWASETRPHVTLDRISLAPSLYEVGQTWFARDCGLHFLVSWRDPSSRGQFEHLLTQLGHRGLGGERSRGFGAFDWQVGPETTWPQPTGLAMTISRYHPTGPELATGVLTGPGTAYLLEGVGGWLSAQGAAAERRRQLMFVAEGAIIRAGGSSTLGELVDVTPIPQGNTLPHRVYRYGYALTIGLQEAA